MFQLENSFSFGAIQYSSRRCSVRQIASQTITICPCLLYVGDWSQALQLQLQNKLSLDVLHLLNWWKQHRFFLQGIAVRANPPFHLIYTDSSLLGSDSYLRLTMMVISLALRNAHQFIKNLTVLISKDKQQY